jgi:hypothetical protein
MSQFGRGYDINQTFIIEPQDNNLPVLSACTVVYTNFIESCSGDTQIFLSTGIVSINGTLEAQVVSATTYYGNGGNLTGIPYVTGATYSDGTATFTNNTGGTFSVSGFAGDFTGGTVSTLSATTISGGTIYGDGSNLNMFTQDIVVSLTNGKTLGKYVNGETVPAIGKTVQQVLLDIAFENIVPTANLSSPTTVIFNQTSINNVLNFSNTINTPGATISSGSLEWRRGGVGSWTVLTSTTVSSGSFTHSITDTNFNTQSFNYRYIVIDSNSLSSTATATITPSSYLIPTITGFNIGMTTRDLGDVNTTISGTIVRNSINVNITGYTIEYQINGSGSWVQITSGSTGPTGGSFSYNHNDVSLINSISISYRVKVIDGYQTTTITPVLNTISFVYRQAIGYSTNTIITISDITGFTSYTLSNSKAGTKTNVTAAPSQYTYYAYAASAGDLTNVIQDGAAPVLGAFTKLSDVTGLNNYGVSVTYRVYKSNATLAFTNNTLTFS